MQPQPTSTADQIEALIASFRHQVPDAEVTHQDTTITVRLILPTSVYGPYSIDYSSRAGRPDMPRQFRRVEQFLADQLQLIEWERAGRPGDEI